MRVTSYALSGIFRYTNTLATLEPGQTSLILFSKFDINRVASTWEVPIVVLLSTFKIKLHQSGTVLKLLV